MMKPIKAVFRDGVFVPEAQPELPEGTAVEVTIANPPTVTDPEAREKILNRFIERMRNNPLLADASRFTREQLHERP